MKIKYDKKTDSVYIEMSEGKYEVSRKVSESVLVDEDKKGKVLGIEILDAKKNFPEFNSSAKSFKIQTL